MPEVTCPHCRQVNLVAGYYEREVTAHPQGKADERLYCGFCGKRFWPRKAEAKAVAQE